MVLRYTFILALCFLVACNYYEPRNDQMQDIPSKNNLNSSVSIQLLLDALEEQESAEAHYKLAKIYAQKEQWANALRHSKQATQLNPQNPDFLYFRASLLIKADSMVLASKTLQKALSNNPSYWQAELLLADIAMQRRDYKKVQKHLDKVSARVPQEVAIFHLKGRLAMAQKDSAAALKNFKRVLQMQPDFIHTYNSISYLYNTLEMPEKAIYYANLGLRYTNNGDSLYLQKGVAYQALENTDSAKVAFEKAYQRNLDLYTASYELAQIALKERQYRVAYRYVQHSLNYNKNLPKIYLYEGICLQNLGRDNEALEAFKKALKQDAQDLTAQQYYARLREKKELERLKAIQDSIYQAQQEAQQRYLEQLNKDND